MTSRILIVFLSFACSQTILLGDFIILTNGDQITGQINRVTQDQVRIESPLIGKISARWSAVKNMHSDSTLYVRLLNNNVVIGTVTGTTTTIHVQTASKTLSFATADVASIHSKPDYELMSNKGDSEIQSHLSELWGASIDAAISTTQGNSNTRALNLGVRALRSTERSQFSSYFTAAFASNASSDTYTTTANVIRSGSRFELQVSDKLFNFSFAELEFDRLQELDLRLVLGGGLGLDLLNNQRTKLKLLSGASSNQEFFSNGVTRRTVEVVMGQDLSYRLSQLTNINQSLAVFPNINEMGEFRLSLDTTVLTRLNDWLSWQVTLSNRYLSNPVHGNKRNDLLFTTGIRITPWGKALKKIGPGSTVLN